jgi:hypothetical protein
MRLIDADALKERILEERDAIPTTVVERYSLGVPTPNNHGNSMRGGIRIALRCMEQTPTIDAEPVKHGRWIKHEGYDECNLCHTKTMFGHNYCPNCGAKMEVEQ